MSQDDFLSQDCFELALQSLKLNHSEICLFDFVYFTNTNTDNKTIHGNNNNYDSIDGNNAFILSLKWKIAGAGLYDLKFIKRIGYEDFNMFADEYSVRKFFINSKSVSFCKGTFFYNIDNNNAVTRKPNPNLFSKLSKELKLINLYENNLGTDNYFKSNLNDLVQMYWDYNTVYKNLESELKVKTLEIFIECFKELNKKINFFYFKKLTFKIKIKFLILKVKFSL